MRVLFVCLGNICRSPTAEGVFRRKVEEAGLASRIHVDSAGTAGWHVGKAPDQRTRLAAQRRGYDLSALRGRQVGIEDFSCHDLILAMDLSNLADLETLRAGRGAAELDLFLRRYGSERDEVPRSLLWRRRRLRAGPRPDRACLRPSVDRSQGATVSLELQEHCSLKPYNTFGIDVRARLLAHARDEADVREALALARERGLPLLVIGGGSNLLLTRDVEALVLRMASQGRRIVSDAADSVLVEAEAGEAWDPFVQWSLERGLAGLENLSLIPGTVGAAPMQNIGAYGVELKDVFDSLTALDRQDGTLREFDRQACRFGYRDSLFKQEPDRWLILRVRLRLTRRERLHLDYGPVRQRLEEEGIASPTARDVSRVICAIRREKLPDPAVLGNAGSFFKNPLVDAAQAERLRQAFPDLVGYPQADGRLKLAAGWLIDKGGWKGFRDGPVGVHAQQALVLVNHGGATGAQVRALAERIQEDVRRRFGVELEPEPNLY